MKRAISPLPDLRLSGVVRGNPVWQSGSPDDRDVPQPRWYQVHLHMPCNERCIMCVPSGRHPSASLPFGRFEAFFEQIGEVAEHLTLIGGETLLYPEFDRVIALLASRPIAVTIITNATPLDESIARRLLTLNELELKCSIHAATPDLYHRLHGVDAFDQVMTNVRRFAAMRRGRPRIRQIMTYVVMRENLREAVDFIDLVAPLVPFRIEFHPVRHVSGWRVHNRTGWTFDAGVQRCESFPDEYNRVMEQARTRCREHGIQAEIVPL